MYKPIIPIFFLLLFSGFAGYAQDEADNDWHGEGSLGITNISGNSDSETINAKLGLEREIEAWKHSGSLAAIRAETDGDESADSVVLRARSEYSFSDKSYWFGQFRREEDEFSGFDSQTSITVGAGTRLMESAPHLLDVSIGVGARRLEPQDSDETEEDGVVVAGLDYHYTISETASLGQTLTIEDGSENTYTEAETTLLTQIEGNLAAKISFLLKRNSDVPEGTDKSDRITTVSLVYGF